METTRREFIDSIVAEIGEDKHTNPTTTSNKFKWDLCNYFMNDKFMSANALELGTHKGQTTRILARCFNHVFTVNRSHDLHDEARKLNRDIDNITYIAFDLYSVPITVPITEEQITAVLIDAGHTRRQVDADIHRVLGYHNLSDVFYMIFDDYGLIKDVNDVVNGFLRKHEKYVDTVIEIGHQKGYDFRNGRVLNYGSEGVIVKLNIR